MTDLVRPLRSGTSTLFWLRMTKELLAIPDVVGVYVGTLQDRRTPFLKVMFARKTEESVRKIPRSIEGYPVVIEISGEIRALNNP